MKYILFLAFAAILPAAPILSDGNETCLPAPCTVQVIDRHPAWLEGSWISHADSGANASMLTVANGTVVSFFEHFQIATAPTSASIRFAADDTASLTVNGFLVQPSAPTDGNGYSVCSDFAPTCWAWTEVDIAPWLVAGENVLRFDVEQRGRYGFGLAFEGYITDIGEPPAIPEPITFALVLIGMLIFLVVESIKEFRKRRELSARIDRLDAQFRRYRDALEDIAFELAPDAEHLKSIARKALEEQE